MRHIRHNSPNPQSPDHRSGFSLIELIVVILVIAILLAMLLPAIGNIRRTARSAQVVVDIKNLEAGIANFKLKYGIEPPSSFVICERASDWTSPPSALASKIRESTAIIRELWPDFDFTYSAGTPSGGTDFPAAGQLDINGNKTIDDPIVLNGAECLVFFLGGICATAHEENKDNVNPIVDFTGTQQPESREINVWGPTGFSANPRFPFKRGGQNRVGPFFEFPSDRLKSNTIASTSGSVMPTYIDPHPGQTAPYLYASSRNGRGYPMRTPASGIDSGNPDFLPVSLITYYQQGTMLPYSPKGFQIISPGADGIYGPGGSYKSGQTLSGNRNEERDNITNFSGGPLQP